jgi:hypothetical protein
MINKKGPYKFIFIDIPKNASSSIRDTLMHDLKIGYHSMNFDVCPNHECATLYENHGFNSDDYFKFGIVRNPWDRVVSIYEYNKGKADGEQYGSFENFLTFMYESYKEPKLQLRDPMLNVVNQNYIASNGESVRFNWSTQIDWLRVNGKVWVDYIGRFETLHDSMVEVYKRLGIKNTPTLQKVNTSNRNKDYRSYYNDRLTEMVYEINEEDIKLFEYEF